MTAQMTAQMTPLPLTFFEPESDARADLAPDTAPDVPTGLAAHAELADVLLDRPAAIAPWNVIDGDARRRVDGRPTALRTRHLHVVADPTPVATHVRSVHLRRGPVRTVLAGLSLAGLVALASIGVLAFLGADAAASTPASTTGATPSAAVAATPVAVAESVAPAAPQWVVVQAGDSLWTLARRLQPKGDVRRVVDRLADRLGGVSITAGQRIDVRGLLD